MAKRKSGSVGLDTYRDIQRDAHDRSLQSAHIAVRWAEGLGARGNTHSLKKSQGSSTTAILLILTDMQITINFPHFIRMLGSVGLAGLGGFGARF